MVLFIATTPDPLLSIEQNAEVCASTGNDQCDIAGLQIKKQLVVFTNCFT